MSNITVFENLKEVNGVKMMSSNTLASMFEKRHDHVIEKIRNTLESLSSQESGNVINSRYYIEEGLNNSKTYWLDEGLSSLIAGKYSDTYALKVNDFFVREKRSTHVELSPELMLCKSLLESAIANELRTKALEKKTTAIEAKTTSIEAKTIAIEARIEKTISKDDECFSSQQIQELETLFKKIHLKNGDGRQIGELKGLLKKKFLSCPTAGVTYKNIAQKHFLACKKIVEAFI